MVISSALGIWHLKQNNKEGMSLPNQMLAIIEHALIMFQKKMLRET